ncbi:MAG TPA: hypothetical protein VKV33_02875 [Streptosporangiaceae bacterium]|nr:hypothetical protein [Streptosporangiaceae bacterium]
MTRKTVTAWLATNVAVLVLYTVVPPIFLNNGSDRIAGMPEMLFWFTLLPLVIPALMAALYLYDQRLTQAPRQAGRDGPAGSAGPAGPAGPAVRREGQPS